MEKLRHLHGMRDLRQESWEPLKAAQDHLREYFSSHGYRHLETPVLEPTELFLRKSGGELAARMYTFTDPGGNQVSLRPEYTSSILRHYLEEGEAEALPVRIQYAGPVFRYDGDGDSQRQFTQVGAELLGSVSPRADAEVLSLGCTALSSLGLKGHHLEIGDVGVLRGLLSGMGLSERALLFILGSMTELKGGEEGLSKVLERARQLRLLATDARRGYLGAAIAGMDEEEVRELLQSLLLWAEVGSLGQREPSEVVERLLRKFRVSDDPVRLQEGLEIAFRMAAVRGDPEDALAEAGALIESSGLSASVMEPLKETMSLLELAHRQDVTVTLDFGLARGLAYYTGIVFEIRHSAVEISLGGGGRYDELAGALGSPTPVPALGFAYALEPLLEALSLCGSAQANWSAEAPRALVAAKSRGAYGEALRVAQELRLSGKCVEMDVCGLNTEDCVSYARAKGIAEVIVVDDGGKATTHPVRDFREHIGSAG